MAGQWIDRGDVWKDKAKALQIRIRDRFRVAVDKHRNRRPRFTDGYYSSTLHRWVLYFRNLRRDSLPPSSQFYRKRVTKDFDAKEDSAFVRMLQAVAVPVLGNVCYMFMHGLNHVEIYGAEKLHKAYLDRQQGKPLLTVSNHVASVDDPFVIASLLPPSVMLDAQNLRWTLCATDRCFKNSVTSAFFRSVKVLPVSRGDGVYQKGMDLALAKLNKGEWVHIFPEGSRSRDGGITMGFAKRGVGRLVIDADNTPTVVPFVHTGMQDIMPIGAKVPRIGKTVTVLIGDPIHFDDLIAADKDQNISRGALYDAISSRIGQKLLELKIQVDKLALEQPQTHSLGNAERATGILQQVDWEAFGMENYLKTEDDSTSLRQKMQNQPQLDLHQEERPPPSERHFRVGFSRDGGMISRIRGCMDPTEFMGFAARGLFMNNETQNVGRPALREVGPLKVWRQFSESSIFSRWNSIQDSWTGLSA